MDEFVLPRQNVESVFVKLLRDDRRLYLMLLRAVCCYSIHDYQPAAWAKRFTQVIQDRRRRGEFMIRVRNQHSVRGGLWQPRIINGASYRLNIVEASEEGAGS